MLNLISFGYKYGAPPPADLVMDVRFLQNPYWVESLKPGSGLDPEVGAYIEEDPAFASFFVEFRQKAESLLASGGTTKTIAAGCTGGRHRSVYVMEKLARELKTTTDIAIEHRDLRH